MKKILVFTSDGAGGHTATTNALKATFSDLYEVQPVNIFKDVISPLDIIKTLSFGKQHGEKFYEQFMAKKYFRFLNALHYVGKWYFRRRKSTISNLIENSLLTHNPDLVISVIPLVDGAIIDACQKLNLPFLLLPTDLDSSNYIHDINAPNHKKFHVALPFDDDEIRGILKPACIPEPHVSVTGFPIRADFFEQKDKMAIKKTYSIDQDKPVIFLLMGSVGSDALYSFSQQLATLTFPVHIVICVGRYKEMKEKLYTIDFPAHISITIIEFIQKISDLMSVADLLITKAGPVSMSEAMYMNLPMLVDVTCSTLAWEKFNYEFIRKRQFGDIIERVEDIPRLVTQILQNKNRLNTMKQNLMNFDKKHGGNEVKKIVTSMLEI